MESVTQPSPSIASRTRSRNTSAPHDSQFGPWCRASISTCRRPRVRAISPASVVLPLPLGPVMAMRISETELAARDDDGRAADLNALDRLRGALDSCVERRGAADLRALRDLDLVPERDAAVAREMQRERAGGRSGRGILRHAEPRPEHARLPAQAVLGEAVHTVRADRSEPLLVGLQR